MNNSKPLSNAKSIAFVGVMSALMFIIMFLETYVFTFLIPLAPPCVLSLSLAITLSVFGSKGNMFVGGTIMGICSFIIAFMIANPVFIFPWISILPRIFIGIVSYLMTRLFIVIFSRNKKAFVRDYIPYSLGAIFGVLTNTILVLLLLYLFKFIGVEDVVATFLAINFPVEVLGSAILVPVLVNSIKRYKGSI